MCRLERVTAVINAGSPYPHYAGEIWKRPFHSENASNVFCPHYTSGTWKRNNLNYFLFAFMGHTGREIIWLSPRGCLPKAPLSKYISSTLKHINLRWTEHIIVEIKLHFQISLVKCGRDFRGASGMELLDPPRGRDSCCWPKGLQPLGFRMNGTW